MKSQKTIKEIEDKYELELDKIVEGIKKQKAKKILLQFPDGMKPYAVVIKEELEKKCKNEKINVSFFIWLDSCFGACDVPLETRKLGIDLIVQFGHSAWVFK